MACLTLLPTGGLPAEFSLSELCHLSDLCCKRIQSRIRWYCFFTRKFNLSHGEALKGLKWPDHGLQPRLIGARGSRRKTVGAVVSISKASCADISFDSGYGQTSKPTRNYVVRETKIDEELWAAAWIRAESYCEDQPHVRYIESYKKRFAEQEFDALRKRLNGKHGLSVRCICFVAVYAAEIPTPIDVTGQSSQNGDLNGSQTETTLERVVGTLDLSVRHLSPSETFPGDSIRATLSMDAVDHRGFYRYGYIANVCVAEPSRKKGVASSLLRAAIDVAKEWGLKELFVHVNSGNTGANQLYAKHNFEILQAGAVQHGLQNISLLHRTL